MRSQDKMFVFSSIFAQSSELSFVTNENRLFSTETICFRNLNIKNCHYPCGDIESPDRNGIINPVLAEK